nr:reverse transcriptase domain-containing protein [Tanacetum cinerariifolium]
MQTRSSLKFVSGSSLNPISSNSKHRNQICSKPRVEPFSIPIVTMADNRTMEEMLQAPTEGITLTLKFKDGPNDAIKLMLFSYSLEGAAKIWYEKEPPRSILTWGAQETFGEAWERFKEMLRQCPHHGFLELHQINTFYNGLNEHKQDSLNSTASGNLLRKNPRDAMIIIENKSKVRYARNKPVAFKIDNFKSGLKNEIHSSIQNQINSVKNELRNDISNQTNELRNMMASYFQMNTVSSSGSGSLPSNTVPNAREDLKAITTRSGVTLAGPLVSPPLSTEVNQEPETITDQELTESTNNVPPLVVRPFLDSTSFSTNSSSKIPEVTKNTIKSSTKNIQPPVTQVLIEPVVAPKLKPTIPYPSRANKQKLREKDDMLALKFVKIFRNLHLELSFAYALLHMPKFALMFTSLLNNKDKLFDLATNLVYENCSAVILKKLHEKLGDPGKFLIPCDFPELECLALTDLAGIAEDVFVKVGKFHFPTDFVVVDYIVDPRVPLILGRPFLRIGRALIDVYGEELTLCVDDEAITFNVGQTLKYSYKDAESINRIDVIDVACEEYVQEVLGFSEKSKSGSPTPTSDPIISSSSTLFTPFEGSDFILEEIETFLQTPDELSDLDDDYYDTEGDIFYLENLLNEDPSPNVLLVKAKDLKQVDATMTKPSIDEPPDLDLKELLSHLEYAFLEGTDKLPVIISKELKDEEKKFPN